MINGVSIFVNEAFIFLIVAVSFTNGAEPRPVPSLSIMYCTLSIALPRKIKTIQTPGRFQTTSHPLSQIPLSCIDIVSKVYSFVAFPPKELF